MSGKRRNTSSPECDSPSKRQRAQTSPTTTIQSHGADANRSIPYGNNPRDEDQYDSGEEEATDERPQVNTSTGQTGAFPGLSAGDDALFYGPANDGIDYLRMVRSEAQGIPQLLKAQAQSPRGGLGEQEQDKLAGDDNEDDDGGYWDDDGTYTAKPLSGSDVHNNISAISGGVLPKAQIHYYDSLLTQFTVVRATMKCVPPLSAIEMLTSSQPISFPSENKNARNAWLQCVREKDPNPVQIACMDEESCFELVRLLTKKMRNLFGESEIEVVERVGAWVWAVLGKCPEKGELGGEEISDLRRFAQRAVAIRNWLDKVVSREQALQTEHEDDESEDEEATHAINGDIEAAKRRLMAQQTTSQGVVNGEESSSHEAGDQAAAVSNTEVQSTTKEKLVITEMILTVVGEVYGQRDLLELRRQWTQMV